MADREIRGPGASHPRLVVERKVLRDGVYDLLFDMLLSGALAPGANLSIDGLAREVGVSPTPVREALVHLERTGLVSRAALRGYRVAAQLTAQEMSDLADARLIVELGALDKALERRDTLVPLLQNAHLHHLELVNSLERGQPMPDEDARITSYRRYFEADWSFHLTIMRQGENRFILQMADSLGAHVHRLRQSVAHGLNDAREAVSEHGVILHALEDSDDDTVRRAMRDHIEAVRSRSLADLSAGAPTVAVTGRS